ncbi:glycosyltransferase family A protein [Dermacoccus sp. CCH2-D9]|uniref:glycosyltransferase family A protein n=1 Tax=Dermacoccus sp. CCH2-D9 TaxID=1768779 RepID=UPI000A7D5561|nr:glycosyltransferase family A protein [Dermacoccus sp. CCH2-D9]
MQLNVLAAPPIVRVLVDNGRNVDLRALAGVHAPHLAVTVVDATRQAGTAFARNRGIERATTERLLFCDADDVVGPTWVRDGAMALDAHPMFSGGELPFTSDELDRALRDAWATLAGWLPRYLAQPDQVTRDAAGGRTRCCSGARSVCGAVSHAYPRYRSTPTSA